MLARDGPAPPLRARWASACASSALRYRREGDNVAAGDVELGVSVTGVSAAAEGGVIGERVVENDRDIADMEGTCMDAGERAMDEFLIITCGDVR